MADIIHLRCNHCGDPLSQNQGPYCQPCNLNLFYRALPMLLGMLMTAPQRKLAPVPAVVGFYRGYPMYYHSRYILD